MSAKLRWDWLLFYGSDFDPEIRHRTSRPSAAERHYWTTIFAYGRCDAGSGCLEVYSRGEGSNRIQNVAMSFLGGRGLQEVVSRTESGGSKIRIVFSRWAENSYKLIDFTCYTQLFVG